MKKIIRAANKFPKQFSIMVFACFLTSFSFAQINKGDWLVGGSGNYTSGKDNSSSFSTSKYHTIEISGDGGYFVENQVSAGIRLTYSNDRTKNTMNDTVLYDQTTRVINLGPFIRYYILPATFKYNFLVDAVYSFGMIRTKTLNSDFKERQHSYAFTAGPVWFINPTAALELTVSLEHRKFFYDYDYLKLNLGFHIHLGRSGEKSK